MLEESSSTRAEKDTHRLSLGRTLLGQLLKHLFRRLDVLRQVITEQKSVGHSLQGLRVVHAGCLLKVPISSLHASEEKTN